MGCIETCQCHNHSPFDKRLTLTWDVLKPDRFSKGKISWLGLTLTWDVLKLGSGKSLAVCN